MLLNDNNAVVQVQEVNIELFLNLYFLPVG